MGTTHRGVGLRTLAVALMAGLANIGGSGGVKGAVESKAAGEHMMASLRWHHRGIVGHKPSGAAAAKRASVKRRNVLKRRSARR